MKTAQQAVTAMVGDKPWNEARQAAAAPAPSRAPAVAQKTGYTVMQFQLDELPGSRKQVLTVVGHLAKVTEGQRLEVRGDWVTHPQYGRQVMASEVVAVRPETDDELVRYLSSGVLPGALVETFGSGVQEEANGTRAAFAFARDLGLSHAHAHALAERHGNTLEAKMRQDPYAVLEPLGLSLAKKTEVASRPGLCSLSPAALAVLPSRQAAAVNSCLAAAAAREGHSCLPWSELRRPGQRRAVRRALLDPERSGAALCYLPSLAAAERLVAQRLATHGGTPATNNSPSSSSSPEWVDAWLARWRPGGPHPAHQAPLALSEGQRAALRLAASAPVALVTGGPGCGKTSALGAIVALWRAQGKRVRVCAPTGRAAQRLAAALREHGGVLARGFHAGNPLDADAVLVDEASMLSLPLAASLLDALPPRCQLVLVGDADQLPSVGPGSVLATALAARVAPAVELRRVFRQAAGSAIVAAARGLRRRRAAPARAGQRARAGGLCPRRRARRRGARARRLAPSRRGPRSPRRSRPRGEARGWGRDDVLVVSPTRVGPLGTAALNDELQRALNPAPAGQDSDPPSSAQAAPFRRGDRVMQLANDYDREVFNGDQGIVVDYDPAQRVLTCDFPHLLAEGDRSATRVYRGAEVGAIGLAYAVTVHKAQGGEAPCVVLVLSPAHARLLDRRLLYTAITRAKQLLIVIETGADARGAGGPLAQAAANAGATSRHSGLMLRWQAAAGALPRHAPQVFEGVEGAAEEPGAEAQPPW
ncbi:hypothetical protein QBZ16_002417 [Prototheca wickerhamii]|uniref:AAA+ ATPase domain-containing protein n=1 Tax=Prototheca wickerhamii TaxID=3111 RepID=A0AAD9IPC2_PROWI|nr:hypothetical protein QBZ16_002417 [Prototheca wickerhamii]